MEARWAPQAQEGAAGALSTDEANGDSKVAFPGRMSSHKRPDQPKSSLRLWLSNQLGVDRMLCHEIADKLLRGRLFDKPPCGQTIRSLILQHAQHDRAKVVKFFTDLEIAADTAEKIILGTDQPQRRKRPRTKASVDDGAEHAASNESRSQRADATAARERPTAATACAAAGARLALPWSRRGVVHPCACACQRLLTMDRRMGNFINL